MQENKNTRYCSQNELSGTVCISTKRVLDSCRDRDCFENTRVYLTQCGENIIANATNVRTKNANLIWAYVGLDEVPFNRGFFRVTVRYYIKIDLEACHGIGKSEQFSGIAVLEKEVILYGGEGSVISYSSSPENNYCNIGNLETQSNNDPVAVVETVEPVVLSTKILDCPPSCCCECSCACEIPSAVCQCIDGEVVCNSSQGAPRLYSFITE